jgi:hypothetical protein
MNHIPESPITRLAKAISESINDASGYYSRRHQAEETRYCIWAGQSSDGKKHSENYDGEAVFPWEGARDSRVRLADEIVNERVKVLKAAWRRAQVQAVGTESGDSAWGANVTTLLKWVLHTQMGGRMRAEIEYAANVRETFGAVVFGITWEQELRMHMEPIDLRAMMAAAAEDPEFEAQVQMLLDPARDEESLDAIQSLSPALTKSTARNILRELRSTGRSEFPKPEILRSRPLWTALEPMVDVFFPAGTTELQKARWVARREVLDEAALRERELTEDYDPKWIDQAIKKKGNVLHGQLEAMQTLTDRSWRKHSYDMNTTSEERENLIEIWHVYERTSEPKTGIQQVHCRVIHGGVPDLVGKETLLDYDHGQLPFVESVRERVGRAILDSRGVPELVETDQADIKMQRDFKADRSSITILPPMRVPARQAGKLVFGPAAQIPERRKGEIDPMHWPALDAATIQVEGSMVAQVNRYFGRISQEVPELLQNLHLEDLAADWLEDLTECFRQTLQLMQQYMTDEEVARILGSLRQRFNVSRQEIQGQFDILIRFDARDLNSEFVIQKAKVIGELIVPLDVAGVLDRSATVRELMNAFDPQLAERLVRDEESVSEAEVEDEQMQFAKIAAGIEPPIRESGQNAALRLQVMQGIIEANPQLQERYQQDEIFKKLIDTRAQAFQFRLQQEENRQIGRLGVAPALQAPAAQGGTDRTD